MENQIEKYFFREVKKIKLTDILKDSYKSNKYAIVDNDNYILSIVSRIYQLNTNINIYKDFYNKYGYENENFIISYSSISRAVFCVKIKFKNKVNNLYRYIRIMNSYDKSVKFSIDLGFYDEINNNELFGFNTKMKINHKHTIGFKKINFLDFFENNIQKINEHFNLSYNLITVLKNKYIEVNSNLINVILLDLGLNINYKSIILNEYNKYIDKNLFSLYNSINYILNKKFDIIVNKKKLEIPILKRIDLDKKILNKLLIL